VCSCELFLTFFHQTARRRKRESRKIRKREQEIKKKVAVKSRFTYLSKTARGEEEEEEEEEGKEEKEVKKREIYEEENDAVLLRILRRVPHARLRDRSKTTHFGI